MRLIQLMTQIFVFRFLFLGLCLTVSPVFCQKVDGVKVTLQVVHKNRVDTSKNIKPELGLIVELVNQSLKNIAIPISGVNYEKQINFYRKNKNGDYELIVHPQILLQEQQKRTQEYLLKHHRLLVDYFGVDYNSKTSLSLDFFRYWDTFDQDMFSQKMGDGLTTQELVNFKKEAPWFDSSLNFYFLKAGQRQTVFWNLEFMLKEQGDYKITFEPFPSTILKSPLTLTENYEVVEHQFFHANELFIKTY